MAKQLSQLNLKPNPDNPRTITKEAYEQLKGKIQRNPDGLRLHKIGHKDGIIVSGNQRWRAINELKLEPKDEWFEDLTGWTDEQVREWLVTSNISDGAWDWDLLANQYEYPELEGWGLELPSFITEPEEVEEDEAPEVSQDPPVSKLGEIYQLGRHRVMCGDSTDKASVELLMNGVKADLVLTDPPYNIASDSTNFASDVSKAMKDLSESEWDKGFDSRTVVPILQEIADDNSTTYIFTNHFLFGELYEQYKDWASFTSYCVWSKPNPMPSLAKRHWTWNSELCLYATKGKQTFNFINGEHNLSVWDVVKKSDGSHPTQKPIELLANIVLHSSNKNDLVYDLFLGSGSTLIACEQTDRTCYGMELDPRYVDVIRKRYAKHTNGGELPDDWAELTPQIV